MRGIDTVRIGSPSCEKLIIAFACEGADIVDIYRAII